MNDTSNSHGGPNERLRALLRASDPVAADASDAADGANSAVEERALARIAARLIDFEAVRPVRRLAYALPALALATIVAVAWLGVRFAERPRQTALRAGERAAVSSRTTAPAVVEAAPNAPPSRSGGREPESRQIQFETAGGTRVIWVLDPRFAL